MINQQGACGIELLSSLSDSCELFWVFNLNINNREAITFIISNCADNKLKLHYSLVCDVLNLF